MNIELDSRKNAFLLFDLAGEQFAVSVQKALEVLDYQKITKVPNTPDYLTGVINFRGEILPVLNTKLKLKISNFDNISEAVIIVLNIEYEKKKIIVGALADAVKDVVEIGEDQIKPLPDLGSNFNKEFILGVYKSLDNFFMILDIDKVFSIEAKHLN